jgi:hypothetical protein
MSQLMFDTIAGKLKELETRIEALEGKQLEPLKTGLATKLRELADELEDDELIPAKRYDDSDDE